MPNNKNYFPAKQAQYNKPETVRGWKWPLNANKAHYFLDYDSLCGNWEVFSTEFMEDNNHNSQDNCAKCKHIRNRLAEAAENETN